MIAQGFAQEIEVTEGGIKRKCSVLEAILMQLSAKAAKQEKRALRVLMQYQDFCNRHGEADFASRIIFSALEDKG